MLTKNVIAPTYCKRFHSLKERTFLLIDVMISFRDNFRFESELRSLAPGSLWREAAIGGVIDELRLDDQAELTSRFPNPGARTSADLRR
jgi:hypothetical protein